MYLYLITRTSYDPSDQYLAISNASSILSARHKDRDTSRHFGTFIKSLFVNEKQQPLGLPCLLMQPTSFKNTQLEVIERGKKKLGKMIKLKREIELKNF